jgi:DNA uptake protein ComE-like DNA-binding protein
MWERICAYLTFTRKERLGVLVLMVIIIVLFVVPYFFRPQVGSPDPEVYEKYKDGIRKFGDDAGGSAGKKDLSGDYPDRTESASGSSGSSAADDHFAPRENVYSTAAGNPETPRVTALFYFDPNRNSAGDWHRLGLKDKLILTIEHYLQKGGYFRIPSDLKKLYGLRETDYDRLFPYIRIGKPPNTRSESLEKFPAFASGSHRQPRDFKSGFKRSSAAEDFIDRPSYHSFAYSRKKPGDLDINLADSLAWCQFPGIGVRLASRIVHFREKLGGFYSVDQLSETFGLPDSIFQKIKPFLHIREKSLQKIDLNGAEQEALQMHPYIRWKLAREIIQYRIQHEGFKSVTELQQLAQMDPEKFKKLEPYLEIK